MVQLIERETGVRLSSRTTISNYLHDWHFTPQRPKKRASVVKQNASFAQQMKDGRRRLGGIIED